MTTTLATSREIEASYRPIPWLAGGHRMTIAAAYWPRRFTLAGRRSIEREVRVANDVNVWVEIDEPEGVARGTLVLVHGLTGSARSNYMLGTADLALRRGLRVARVNLRGCAARETAPTELYHGGMHRDLAAIVAALGAAYDGAFAVAGFSLGGNLVANLAARARSSDGSRIVAFACVSAPLDLLACAERIDRPGIAAIYRRHFVSRLIAEYRRRCRAAPDRYRSDAVAGVRSVIGFDDAVTAPVFGFEDARQYYCAASAAPHLAGIELPTLLLCAQDDPIIDAAEYQRLRGVVRSEVTIATPTSGGHLGYLAAVEPRSSDRTSRFWAEHAIVDFLASTLFAAPGI